MDENLRHILNESAGVISKLQLLSVFFEDEMVYSEPGVDVGALEAAGRTVSPFRARNLFFGGAQAAALDADGRFSGGGDPRRGGAAIVVEAA